jgi:hypothetical protein
MSSTGTQSGLPILLFQFSSRGLELLNRKWEDYPTLSPNLWLGISRGGWRSLVPEEYHSEVEKLAQLSHGDGYAVIEFPVYWQENMLWLLMFAAAVEEPGGERKIVGFVQDTSGQQQEMLFAQASPLGITNRERPGRSLQDLCHDISGPLTTILVNCELLMDGDCPSPARQRIETILSEAMHIDQHLRHRRE